jgi:CRP/FNR family transcriptional regulator
MINEVKSKIWYLKHFDLFSELPAEDLKFLDQISYMMKFPKKEYIYFPEDPANTIFLLKEGRVKISLLTEKGRELTLAILEPGEVFGELALVDEGNRQTLAEALEDTLICVIKREDFKKLLKKQPDLALKIIKLIGLRRKAIESKIEYLVFRDVPARLAHLLLNLAEEYGVKTSEGIKLRVRLTHQEIGNLIGATRETTTATLNRLKELRLIDFRLRHLIIVDKNKLQQLTEIGNN